MPWCGIWGTAGGPLWWILPLIGIIFVAIMFFVCFRCFGRFGRISGCRCKPSHSDGRGVASPGRPS